jgi:hypothetical protein
MRTSAIGWIGALPKKPLRPITIAVAGPSTLSVATSIAVFLSPPEPHRWSELLIAFGMGAAIGLTVFVPIAAALAFSTRLFGWLERYGSRVEWYMSISMAVSLGYIAASVHQRSVDGITVVTLLVVFLCALAKTALGIAFRDRGEPPVSGISGGSRPPTAPVLRPPGGPPPVFSATAPLKHDRGG